MLGQNFQTWSMKDFPEIMWRRQVQISSRAKSLPRLEERTRQCSLPLYPPPNPNLILKTNLSFFWLKYRPTWDLCDIPVISFKTNACIFVIGNKCVFKKYTIRQWVYQQIWETYCTLHRTSTFDFIAKTEIFNLITIFFLPFGHIINSNDLGLGDRLTLFQVIHRAQSRARKNTRGCFQYLIYLQTRESQSK